MELLEYWRTIKKRLWLIALLVVLAVAGALFWAGQQVPLYSTSTTLFLNPAAPSALLPYEGAGSLGSLANTYAEFMRTRSFAGLVAAALETPLAEEAILQALSTRLVPNTQFFQISATHPDPRMAQDLANSAAEVLIAENAARQQAQRRQIEAQRDPAKALEQQQLTELQAALQDELTFHSDRIAALQEEIAALEDRPPSAETDQLLLDLREELVRHQTLRVEIFGSLAQTQAALAAGGDDGSGLVVDTAVVVDPAPLPTEPLPQNRLRYTLLAVVVAAGLGVGLAYLIEYLDWTIKTPDELEAAYGMGTLGVISTFPKENGRRDDPAELIALHAPRSPISEAYRALRTNIQFARPGQAIRSLLVTSAGPVEGKTATAANLAVVLAQGGQRVILVDADLRRPRLHRLFEVPREPGLTDLIVGRDDDVAGYLQPTAQENLHVLPCGPLPRNPAELLASARAAEVMDRIGARADVVVYDSPPAATVTDAVLLGARVDGVIQVVEAGGPRRDVVQRARRLLEKVGAPLLGPVLNRVDAADMGYYAYYYYYGYGHDGDGAGQRAGLLGRLRRRERRGGNEEEVAG